MSSLKFEDLASLDIERVSPEVAGKRIFWRADLDVPRSGDAITDTTRLKRAGRGIRSLAERGACVVVAGHSGRPKGERGERIEALSLAPIAAALSEAMDYPISFLPDCIGDEVEAAVSSLGDGSVVVLENLRFHAGEESGDADFARALARLADMYVNDAFATSHRAHASMVGVARELPSYIGPALAEELSVLSSTLGGSVSPLVAVIGGAKVSTKLGVLGNLISKVDALIIGGGMANTFLLASGVEVGGSLAEADMVDEARRILADAEKAGCQILLPKNVVVAKELKAGAETRLVNFSEGAVASDEMILDIGDASLERFKGAIEGAKTLIWNGPLGAFEVAPFDRGTTALADYVAKRTADGGLVSVAGGGDTVSALGAAGIDVTNSGEGKTAKSFGYVSSAGGAFLEWMEGKPLPALTALIKK